MRILSLLVLAGLVLTSPGPLTDRGAAASGVPAVERPSANARTETAAGPTGEPVAVPPVPGEVVRGFEAPAHRYGPGHRGVALRAGPGEPVRAALRGRVSFAGDVARTGWVSVDHGGGLVTSYGPLDPIAVGAGAAVQVGDVVGRLAPEATSLHWGARLDGAYIDPLLLLGAWEVYLTPRPRAGR